MKSNNLILAAFLLFSTSALALEEGDPCDAATDAETCEATIIGFCDANTDTWVKWDCPAFFGESAVCTFVDDLAWCAAPTNTTCIAVDEGVSRLAYCLDDGTGCDLASNATCVTGAPECTPPAAGDNFNSFCEDNKSVWGCFWEDSPLFDDCTVLGGTCNDGSYCIDIGLGGTCDGEFSELGANAWWSCATGLTCHGGDEGLGSCIPTQETCGTEYTWLGSCAGDVVVYCSDQNNDPTAALRTFDCGDITGDGQNVANCHVYDDIGAWCAVKEGGRCVFTNTNTNSNVSFPCYDVDNPDANLTCNTSTGLCETSTVSCPDGGNYTCDNNNLVYCSGTGNYTVDCTSDGVQGTGCNNGACTGLIEDAFCNDTTFLCAEELACNGLTDTQAGQCTSDLDGGIAIDSDGGTTDTGDAGTSGPGAGVGFGDDGDDDRDDDPIDDGTGENDAGTTGSTDGTGTGHGGIDGTTNGTTDGTTNGTTDGTTDGATDGTADGTADGAAEGETDGNIVAQPRSDTPATAPAQDGGCACQGAKTSSTSAYGLWGLFLLPLLLRRKRS